MILPFLTRLEGIYVASRSGTLVGMPAPAPTRTAPRPRRSGRPTLEQAAELDQTVRECALRLFLDHGYEGTSMDAIAREAHTTKMSLYGRFASKEELFLSVRSEEH